MLPKLQRLLRPVLTHRGAGMRQCRAFVSDDRGAIVLVFALALPTLVAGVAAATEYGSIIQRRAQLQTAADGAALAAGKELTLASADQRVASVAEATAKSMLAMNSVAKNVPTITSRVLDNRAGVEVTIEENIPFMMGHVLGYPSADVGVRAVARLTGGARRLCVVAIEPVKEGIRLDERAKLTAVRCEVQSDSKDPQGIKVYNDGLLASAGTCTAGGYKGSKSSSFSPTPTTDCPQLGDPLVKRAPPNVGACKETTTKIVSQPETLDPGTYCGGIKILAGGLAKLTAGIYVMENGRLEMQDGSGLTGENVGFYFRGDASYLEVATNTSLSLTAPNSGALAGILFFEDRNATIGRKFRLLSDNAEQLLGTIYLSRGIFEVGSNKPVAAKSAYTVIVARQIAMAAGPDFVLNSDYGSTDIPVPEGVGNNIPAGVTLAQ